MLQKLHERLADRKDVAVLTLNADQNPGLVEPLLREKKYTFPTGFATDYLQSLGDVNAFPTNWIVDLSGAVRLESVGFGLADGEGWLDEVLKQLEQPPTNSGS